MARHDVDPVLHQLVRAVNWRASLEAVDAWTLRDGTGREPDNRGPFERLLGSA